ncbi:MAG: M23 family metallopeptidase [Mariprofundaceae bacterium]|nr:M23 family metallopeptidase [Mariprofundaceae bacterium]
MPYLIILILSLSFISPAYAHDWHATQGDIIEVDLTSNTQIHKLTCMGKEWPFKKDNNGTIHGWIGVDLKQKEGNYPIQWVGVNAITTDHLSINKGKFRISRITVDKKMSSFDAAAIKRIHADQQAIKKTYAMNVDIFPLFTKASIPVEGIESTPFGAQRYVNGQAKSPHSGIDIAAPKGTAIKAPLAGKVLLVEDMFLNGTLIAIGHGQGLVTLYAHLSKTYVHMGDNVQAGQIIAEVGSTGRSTGAHLHWGVRFNHARINPRSLLSLSSKK